MLNGVIVDDELKSRESLKMILEEFCENVQVKAVCKNCAEAVEAITTFNPDVVFLDIQMQRETGFDLLAQLTDIRFEVIFTTAYSEYAVKAFKFSAIDYLLKPISIEELKKAVQKVEKKLSGSINHRIEHLMNNLRPSIKGNKLALPANDGLIFVYVEDILYCEAASNYTIFHMDDGQEHVVSRTLREYEDMLTDHNFFRIHNSHLINMNSVKKYVKGEGGYVIMENDKALDVSRRRKQAFLERLGQ